MIKTNYCWLWNGYQNKFGYGMIYSGKKLIYVHRLSVTLHGKSIPKGKEINHFCRTRNCVNPGHFQFVTHKENMRMIYDEEYEPEQDVIFIEYSDLLPIEKCIASLSYSMGNWGGLPEVKQMLSINNIFHRRLIIPLAVGMPYSDRYDDYVKDPFKYKYFWTLYQILEDHGFSLSEIEAFLENPLSINLKNYLVGEGLLDSTKNNPVAA